MTPAAIQAMLNGDISNVIAATTPEGIERQEAAGQSAMAKAADRLPLEINYPHGLTHAQVAEALGIQFGKTVDRVFIEATLPDGWKIVPTSHAMWSDLVDDKGRKRAAIFFKAAFYDYNAHISFECRYVIDGYVDDVGVDGVTMRKCQVVDKATDQPLWTSEAADDRDFKAQDRNREEATAWLNAQFPKHDDPFAYWND
jgi:hypothetical protein